MHTYCIYCAHALCAALDIQLTLNAQVFSSLSIQESGICSSPDSERAWMLQCYSQLGKVAALLTPAYERLLKAIDTRNLSDFV